MVLTEQQQQELAARNAAICERYRELTASQPLATANKIITFIANERMMTPQAIGRILRENGENTVTQPIQQVTL